MPGADGTIAWRELYIEAQTRLADVVESPGVDARRLVEEAGGFSGAEFVLGLDELVTNGGISRFDAMIERRLAGEPLQYVLGNWGFRTLDLLVDRRVLIPRPETEGVVDVALAEIDRLGATRVVDLGTGSGAIALSIAAERSDVEVWATDASPDALAVARGNLAGLGTAGTRVRLTEGSWFEALPEDLGGTIQVLVSNPPYVAPSDALPQQVRDWEPAEALLAEPSGFEHIAHIIEHASAWLADAAALVIEIGETQDRAATDAARGAGFTEVEVLPDLAGRPRTLRARR